MAEELHHKACVDLIMQEYGIPKDSRQEILDEVLRIHHPVNMPHFVIIRSIRGFLRVGATSSLTSIINRRKTHEGLHKKGSPDYAPGKKRPPLIEPSFEHQ